MERVRSRRGLYALSDRAAQARIVMRLLRVSQGNIGDHRERIAEAISEMRIDYGPGYRVYYARLRELTVVLLGGGTKDHQQRDIEAALAFWQRNKDNVERLSRDYRPPHD